MIEALNELSQHWFSLILRASVHGGVALAGIAALSFVFRRTTTPAWVENWLWRLGFAKCLVLLLLFQPIAIAVLPPPVLAPPLLERTASSHSISSIDANPMVISDHPKSTDNLIDSAAVATLNVAAVDHAVVSTARNNHRQRSISWQTVLMIGWLAIVVSNGILLLRQYLQCIGLPRRRVDAPHLHKLARSLSTQLRVPVPRLAVSDNISGPALIGLWDPTIVFSSASLAQCSESQHRAVIAHELAHLRRHDLGWNLLSAIAKALFFFHPLVWLATHRHRVTSEMACDNLAIGITQATPAEYAGDLLRLAMIHSDSFPHEHQLGCASVTGSTQTLKQRITAMKRSHQPSPRRVMLYVTLIGSLAVMGVAPWQLVPRAAAADEEPIKSPAENMDFEQGSPDSGATHWGGGGEGYQLELDDEVVHAGKQSARITGIASSGFGTFTQCVDAESLRGQRIALSGFLKSDLTPNADGGLWMRVDGGDQAIEFDNMADRRVEGETDWKKYQVVLDVPEKATRICFGFLMRGKGKLWGDRFQLDAVSKLGQGMPTTGVDTTSPPFARPTDIVNADFELAAQSKHEFARGWSGGGPGYELTRDESNQHSGKASGKIKHIDPQGRAGTFTQMIAADQYRGKRVRYSGYLKCDQAKSAGLWMRVDGQDRKVLAFDNMQRRPVSGTQDWERYEIVLDVSADAEAIAFGFLLIGEGTLWADDLELSSVGEAGTGKTTTGFDPTKVARPTDLVNGDFEAKSPIAAAKPDRWGGGGRGYELSRDEDEHHSGTASGKITRLDESGVFGTYTQMFPAEKYAGKRIRFTGYLKTKDATKAGLWMRIDGDKRQVLGFDNMSNRAVKRDTEWTQYSVVLDVPDSAKFIAMGFLLSGEGTVWGDDLSLSAIDKADAETTNLR
ncbi:MAG: M56 family metallopeptidase [Pirellulaceae bacterium]|nr:M56 family metallopeptidase [Pirellulaceae bacterium]